MAMRVQDALPTDWRDVFAPGAPRIGVGLDPATTTKGKSNPSGLAVAQQIGLSYFLRLLVRFKTSDPDVTRWLVRHILTTLPHGLRARRLCIDATNERFFATDLRKQLAAVVPVELVVASETTTYLGEEMTYKAYLGNLLVNTLEDGYMPLPAEPWVKTDFRLVNRDRGSFESDLGEDGGHGDCFDAAKLALRALTGAGGPVAAEAARVGEFTSTNRTQRPGLKNPWAGRFERQPGRMT